MIDLDAPQDRDDALAGLLAGWLPGRRWYPAKGVEATTTVHAATDLGDPDVRVLLLRIRSAGEHPVDVLLQVPLVLGGEGPGEVLGTVDGLVVRDGAADPRFLDAWLRAADGPGGAVDTAALDTAAARVLSGEQSNTSVILPGPLGAAPVGMLKVLRVVQPGENPDVDVPRHLVDVGWDGVPAPLGWLQGTWPDPADPSAPRQQGYLAALAAFVPQAEDGFELACATARAGGSFADQAALLGTQVAQMHVALARAYGVEADESGASDASVVADALATRLRWAVGAVPDLSPWVPAVTAVVDQVRAAAVAPARQRVHGDLHLGQVLRSGTAWFITDFEGEPAAPLAERTRPDLAVRDVAGMLRSMDYAAAVGGLTGPAASAWADEARGALLDAYRAALAPAGGAHAAPAPTPPDDTLMLTAMELDKTLYEAVYEARNRPDWLPIPLAGLSRLLPS